MKYKFYIFTFSVLLFSCRQEKYPGFSKTEVEIFYKLEKFGDSEKKIEYGEYVKAVIVYFDYENKRTEEIPNCPDGTTIFLAEKDDNGRFCNALPFLSEGDSATIINDKLKTRTLIKIYRVLSEKEYREEKNKQKEFGELNEHENIEIYLKENCVTPDTFQNGVYIINKTVGSGHELKYGDKIQISYKGFFLNGRCFDSVTVKTPLEFKYGTEGQIIDGLNIALSKMREGGKTKIIIPSHLAFGEQGSSTGIIPPFCPLIYEVELIKVITNE